MMSAAKVPDFLQSVSLFHEINEIFLFFFLWAVFIWVYMME